MKKNKLYATTELRNISTSPACPIIRPLCHLQHMTYHFDETNGTTLWIGVPCTKGRESYNFN
jgi:hypothetical protein